MSLSWSARRKILYFSIVLGALVVALIILIYPHFNKAPTCFDGKQNGDESGLDCGGSCQKVCTSQAIQLVTLWARAFEVTPGKYNVMAYVENQNRESGIASINYEFKLYDADNIFIARQSGTTFITSNDRTAIFEPGIMTGNRVPARVSFEWKSVPTWQKVNRTQKNALALSTENIVLSNPLETPKLEASIVNKTLNDLRALDVYAILYDESGNVITASKTLVDFLAKETSSPVVFTWPQALRERPARIDVFAQVNVFGLSLIN
jgi:hypothetical protein